MDLLTGKLFQEFQKLFPDIPVQPEFYIGAYYGGTHDDLPMIGMLCMMRYQTAILFLHTEIMGLCITWF